MAITNQERVAKALDLLKDGLASFAEREIHQAVKDGAVKMETIRRFADDPLRAEKRAVQSRSVGAAKRTSATDLSAWHEGHHGRITCVDTVALSRASPHPPFGHLLPRKSAGEGEMLE